MAESWGGGGARLAEEAAALQIWPLDEHNARLLDAVHPRAWADPPAPAEPFDLIAIGAGAGGLVAAKQSARRGARSALVSAHLAGGDCLNVGCVPSKALLSVARAARTARRLAAEGVLVGADGAPLAPHVDFAAAMARLRRLRAQIAPADAHAATEAAGARVFQGRARFTGRDSLEVNGRTLTFKKAVLCTGGRAALPAGVRGLAEAPYLTHATLFNLTALPPRMVVVGAGAVGVEMAQAFAAFGSAVTVLVCSRRVLPRAAEAAARAVQAAMEADGVRFLFGARLAAVSSEAACGGAALPLLRLEVEGLEGSVALECEALLLAAGRAPNVEGLGLEAAGVRCSAEGVVVNDLLQTDNPNVFAVGDCVAGVPRLTHVSGEMAKMAVQNALFGGAWRLSSLVVPHVVYTEPEVATVGLSAEEAEGAAVAVDKYESSLEHNDRCILEGEAADGGFVSVVCAKGSDSVLGATIVASRAGEMVNELTLAIKEKVGLEAIGRSIHAYPTAGEAVMGCGLAYIRSKWAVLEHLDDAAFLFRGAGAVLGVRFV